MTHNTPSPATPSDPHDERHQRRMMRAEEIEARAKAEVARAAAIRAYVLLGIPVLTFITTTMVAWHRLA